MCVLGGRGGRVRMWKREQGSRKGGRGKKHLSKTPTRNLEKSSVDEKRDLVNRESA